LRVILRTKLHANKNINPKISILDIKFNRSTLKMSKWIFAFDYHAEYYNRSTLGRLLFELWWFFCRLVMSINLFVNKTFQKNDQWCEEMIGELKRKLIITIRYLIVMHWGYYRMISLYFLYCIVIHYYRHRWTHFKISRHRDPQWVYCVDHSLAFVMLVMLQRPCLRVYPFWFFDKHEFYDKFNKFLCTILILFN
jgi:branched-subunit amino acid transport protein AzlD